MDTTPHVCYEGACASGPKRREFSSSRALRQHENRCHQDTPEEETSLGSARSLKRKRDAEDKEEQERQRLKAQLTFEAATRVPDPPVVPLFKRTVDTGLQRSAQTRRLPARFRDSLPTSTAPVNLNRQHCTQVEIPQPLPDLGPQLEDLTSSTNPTHTANANSFGIFREYSTLSSHNPRNPDAFADVSTATVSPQPQSVGSGLTAVTPLEPELNSPPDSTNQSEDLLLAWMATNSGNTPECVNNLVHNVILHPDFDGPDLKDFNAVTATRRFEWRQSSKPGKSLKAGDGWKEGSVSIRVPCTGVKQRESKAPEFTISGILYRDIVTNSGDS